jgi:hypothetical protein
MMRSAIVQVAEAQFAMLYPRGLLQDLDSDAVDESRVLPTIHSSLYGADEQRALATLASQVAAALTHLPGLTTKVPFLPSLICFSERLMMLEQQIACSGAFGTLLLLETLENAGVEPSSL